MRNQPLDQKWDFFPVYCVLLIHNSNAGEQERTGDSREQNERWWEQVKLMYQEKWEEWGEKAGEKFLNIGQGCGGMLWRRRDTGSSQGEKEGSIWSFSSLNKWKTQWDIRTCSKWKQSVIIYQNDKFWSEKIFLFPLQTAWLVRLLLLFWFKLPWSQIL